MSAVPTRRRRRGQLRLLTRDDRLAKAARNQRRGRDRPYVPRGRRSGAPAAPQLPPVDEVLDRARAQHEGRSSRPTSPARMGKLLDSVKRALRIGHRGGDR